jgi:menaquinone-9 beta-reductase
MGWNVLLLDKASFPRDKICGDFISPRSLRVVEALGCMPALKQAQPNHLNCASLYLNGELLTAGVIPQVEDLPNYGCTLPRFVFDEILFRRAQALGVETVENCEVKNLNIDADGVTLHAHYGKEAHDFRGQLVIGADGVHSVVARALGMEYHNSKSIILALRAYYEGMDGDPCKAELFFDDSYFPGYAWIFPLGQGRANVGLGMVMDVQRRCHINLRDRFTDWLENDPAVRARLGNAKIKGRIIGWPLNTYRAVGGNYAERALLVGDAAGFVDPINGEGIHTALESARIAAMVAHEALQAGNFSQAFLNRYERRWRNAFDLDLRTSDLIVTIIKNRSLMWSWLFILKMIGEKALSDRDYAATCGGVLSGVVPTHCSLSPTIMVKTLMHGPSFWQRNLGLKFDRGVLGLINSGLMAASGALDAFSEMASQPIQTVDWGLDVATKGLDILSGLSREYSDDLMTRLFNDFFYSWLAKTRNSQEQPTSQG